MLVKILLDLRQSISYVESGSDASKVVMLAPKADSSLANPKSLKMRNAAKSKRNHPCETLSTITHMFEPQTA